jgi:hypothetical protein
LHLVDGVVELVDQPFMSPRSKGVMKVRLIPTNTAGKWRRPGLHAARCGRRLPPPWAAFQQIAQGDRSIHQGAGMVIELPKNFSRAASMPENEAP